MATEWMKNEFEQKLIEALEKKAENEGIGPVFACDALNALANHRQSIAAREQAAALTDLANQLLPVTKLLSELGEELKKAAQEE